MTQTKKPQVITVTLNPALDYTLHVKTLEQGIVNRADRIDFACGGKGLKVAVNLNIAGIDASATGFMGAVNDQRFCALFEQKSVQDDFIRIEGAETRRNIKIVDEAGETTDINLQGIVISDEKKAELIALIDAQLPDAEVLMFGGSLPPNFPKDFYAQMIKRYKNSGKFLVVDTSGAALIELMKADILPDFIKPNIHELREMTGKALDSDAEIIATAREFVARGMQLVVVSMGADGAWFVTKDEALHASPPRVKIASTVGAGDAMVAGVIRGILLGRGLTEIAKTATAFGAANVENLSSFISTRDRIDVLRERVVIIHEGEER